MILITSFGEFPFIILLLVFFFLKLVHLTIKKKKKKKNFFAAGLFLCYPVFDAGIHVPVGLNCEQMEPPHEEQYSQERNPRAYMSMRDYRNPPWVSAPLCSVPPTYAPPPQPPQPISPVEQAILDLTKLVGDVVEEQKKFNS